MTTWCVEDVDQITISIDLFMTLKLGITYKVLRFSPLKSTHGRFSLLKALSFLRSPTSVMNYLHASYVFVLFDSSAKLRKSGIE